jgi:hypothetical protein
LTGRRPRQTRPPSARRTRRTGWRSWKNRSSYRHNITGAREKSRRINWVRCSIDHTQKSGRMIYVTAVPISPSRGNLEARDHAFRHGNRALGKKPRSRPSASRRGLPPTTFFPGRAILAAVRTSANLCRRRQRGFGVYFSMHLLLGQGVRGLTPMRPWCLAASELLSTNVLGSWDRDLYCRRISMPSPERGLLARPPGAVPRFARFCLPDRRDCRSRPAYSVV